MTAVFRIEIEAEIPTGNTDLGPEAQVATKAKVAELVDELTKMGLLNVNGTRRVSNKTGPRPAKEAPPAPAVQGIDPATGQPTAAVRAAVGAREGHGHVKPVAAE